MTAKCFNYVSEQDSSYCLIEYSYTVVIRGAAADIPRNTEPFIAHPTLSRQWLPGP
jgi:hypothetical protein